LSHSAIGLVGITYEYAAFYVTWKFINNSFINTKRCCITSTAATITYRELL